MIVVGEEGRGREDWKSAEISPDLSKAEQDLPLEIMKWKASWFFVRLYDHSEQLLYSMDFRLARGLSAVMINQTTPFPAANGHSATMVEFHHAAECKITPPTGISPIFSDGRTCADVPAKVEFDKTIWGIAAQDHDPIEISILVERIWWAVAAKEKTLSDSEWNDKTLALTRADFFANSDKVLWIRLPKPKWLDEVRVRFTPETAKIFPIKADKQTVPIPLGDFCDSGSLQQIHQAQFSIWTANCSGTLANVSIRAKCKHCETFRADSEDAILEHLISPEHSETIFAYVDNLTVGLMVCIHSQCQFSNTSHWIFSSTPPVRAICQHAECNHVSHSADSDNRANLIKHHVRQRYDEYRRNRKIFIPADRKCVLCGLVIPKATDDDLFKHLSAKYANELYELC